MKDTQAIRLVVEIKGKQSVYLIRVDRHGVAQIVRDGAPFVDEDTHLIDSVVSKWPGERLPDFKLGVEVVNL